MIREYKNRFQGVECTRFLLLGHQWLTDHKKPIMINDQSKINAR